MAWLKRLLSRCKPTPVKHVNTAASFRVELDDENRLIISMADDDTLLQITMQPEHVAVFVDLGLDSLMQTDPEIISPTSPILENPDTHVRIH